MFTERLKAISIVSIVALLSLILIPPLTLAASAPGLYFAPAIKNLDVGEEVDIDILVYTAGNEVGGVGVKINFDTQVLEATRVSPGNLFDDYPVASIDNTLGKINISGIISSPGSLVSAEGEKFATITFQAIAPGQGLASFNFIPGSTTDSNIAVTYGNGDILERVNQLSITSNAETTSGNQTNPAPTDQAEDTSSTTPSNTVTLTPTPYLTATPTPNFINKVTNSIKHFFGGSTQDQSSDISLRPTSQPLDPDQPFGPQTPITDPDQSQPPSDLPQADTNNNMIFTIIISSIVSLGFIGLASVLWLRNRKKSQSNLPTSSNSPDPQHPISPSNQP